MESRPVYSAVAIRDLGIGDIILYEEREGRVTGIEGSGQDVKLILKVKYRRIVVDTRENGVVMRRTNI